MFLLALAVLIVIGIIDARCDDTSTDSPSRSVRSTPRPELGTAATSTPTPNPTHTPIPTPTPTPVPNLRHIDAKRYMLSLINHERVAAGVPAVSLGDNIAAQLHAEASLEGCFSSHWGADGLKPYMRYSLAGGYQSNGENGHGSDYCITVQSRSSDGYRYRPIDSIAQEIEEAMEGWMDSPGHRRNILGKHHKKVNVGLAWDRYNFKAYQHFEGDYVKYDRLPVIDDGVLVMSGRVKNGAHFNEDRDLGVQIYYDTPPYPLTRGQLSLTYCYDSGRLIASLRPPLPSNRFYPEDEFTRSYEPCISPYHIPTNIPAPRSADEAHEFWQAAYDASQRRAGQLIRVPWITALEWTTGGEVFSVTTDLHSLLAEYGRGVYTVTVWAVISGERAVVSEYSIFHGVTPPGTYDTGRP